MSREDWSYGEPCTNCGSEYLGETCKGHGTLKVTEQGEIDHFDLSELGDPLIVECVECGTELMNKME